MRLSYQWTGTNDRGDGEADLELEPPCCPDHCGGDLFLESDPRDNPESEVWRCCDCKLTWDGCGYEIEDEE
jgi:hypothetical protein